MTKVIYNSRFPAIDRDEFLTPFDRMFDQIINTQFPEIEKQIGIKPFSGTAYPKVNVYEYDDKVGIVAEIPGLTKKQLNVEVEDNNNYANGKTVEQMQEQLEWYQKELNLNPLSWGKKRKNRK